VGELFGAYALEGTQLETLLLHLERSFPGQEW
jgi:hypothetical protein